MDRDMDAKASLLFFFMLALSATTSTAMNISNVLGKYPEYGAFNDLLSKAKLTEQINHRQTITLLALDNSSISSISGRPMDELKKILMNHVVLDYFDVLKIQKLGKRSASLTTLYQTTGVAMDDQGFVNLTKLAPGNVVFGSAVKGSPLVAKLLGSVLSQPFNLSVLHISTPIVAPGFGDPVYAPPPPPGSSPPAPAPKKSPPPADAPSPDAESPDVPSDAPSDAPSPAPAADAPSHRHPADGPSKGMSPADDEPPADSASRQGLSIAVAAVMGLVASLAVF